MLLCTVMASAQTADEYFHAASQQFIFGQYQTSKQTVAEGLRKFPNDPKLSALKEKIKEPPKQDQQSTPQQEQQDRQGQQPQAKPQPQKNGIGKDQADRILQALQNKETEDRKKQQKRASQQETVDRDW
ncbi:MAG: hypothetical protein EG825_17870 [Rhodocyclaceae bacterium]|nr:hypothetical protein [Rhodocyclaceae bacterium]